jgi:hypothetical protein
MEEFNFPIQKVCEIEFQKIKFRRYNAGTIRAAQEFHFCLAGNFP